MTLIVVGFENNDNLLATLHWVASLGILSQSIF
jgi:hypothetical protein